MKIAHTEPSFLDRFQAIRAWVDEGRMDAGPVQTRTSASPRGRVVLRGATARWPRRGPHPQLVLDFPSESARRGDVLAA